MQHRILLFMLAWVLPARCAREVIIDLPEEPTKLVAICHFTEGDRFRMKVSLSKSVNDGTATKFLQDGVDAILSTNGQFWDRLIPDTTKRSEISFWESRIGKTGQAGQTYSFSVRVPGFPVIQSSSYIPQPSPIQHIVVGPADISVVALGDNLSELRVPLELRVKEFPSENHYFAFNLRHETAVYETFMPPTIDFWEEGRTNFLTDGRTFSLLHDIPEPAVLINENYWADNQKTLYLVARIPFNPAYERPRSIFVEWRTLSEDFYRYHLSLSRQGSNLPFSDPDAVFNNIEGGYGNFSGYSVSRDTVLIPDF